MRSASANGTRRTRGRWNASLPSAPRSCCRWRRRGWCIQISFRVWPRAWRASARQVDEPQRSRIAEEAGGATLEGLTGELLHSIDPDATREATVAEYGLADEVEPTSEQLERVERERMTAALKPFTPTGVAPGDH